MMLEYSPNKNDPKTYPIDEYSPNRIDPATWMLTDEEIEEYVRSQQSN